MSFTFPRFIFHFGVSPKPSILPTNHGFFLFSPKKRRFNTTTPLISAQLSSENLLVVVGGEAAGIYRAIRAKTLAPDLNVVVIEKGKPLSKRSLFDQAFRDEIELSELPSVSEFSGFRLRFQGSSLGSSSKYERLTVDTRAPKDDEECVGDFITWKSSVAQFQRDEAKLPY